MHGQEKITPIVNYKKDKDTITVDVDIAANDSNIINLSKDNITKNNSEKDNSISEEIKIDHWNLNIESWTKGKTVLDTNKEK